MKITIFKNREDIIKLIQEILEFEFIEFKGQPVDFNKALDNYGITKRIDSILCKSQKWGITVFQLAEIISDFYIEILLKEKTSENYKKYFLKFLDMLDKELCNV